MAETMRLYNRASSAKNPIWNLTCEGILLMNRLNNNGPRTVPCGTPKSTCTNVDDSPLTITFCCRLAPKRCDSQAYIRPKNVSQLTFRDPDLRLFFISTGQSSNLGKLSEASVERNELCRLGTHGFN